MRSIVLTVKPLPKAVTLAGSADGIRTTYTVDASSGIASGVWRLRVPAPRSPRRRFHRHMEPGVLT